MAQAPNRDELRRELIRLLEGLEFYRAWVIAAIAREKGTVSQDDLDQIVVSGAFFLEIFDNTKGRRCAEILKEVRLWYAYTAGDIWHKAPEVEVKKFFSDFRENVGFDFHAEAGVLRKIAEKVLKAGEIANQGDYHALVELENDLSQAVMSAEELAKVSDLLRQFEG